MVPGAIFPDYELSDHTAKRRKLSQLQGAHPMVLVLSRGGFCPKDRRQAEGLCNCIASSRSAIAGW
jgi:peroxiredoxin